MNEKINTLEIEIKTTHSKKRIIFYIITAVFLVSIFILLLFLNLKASPNLNSTTLFEVTQGQSVKEISQNTKSKKLVKSEFLIYTILTYFYDPTHIYAGNYMFTGNEDVFAVAKKLASSDIENDIVKITLPEGVTVRDMANIFSKKLLNIDYDNFIKQAQSKEGFLFPETYFVPPNFSEKDLVLLLNETYKDIVKNFINEFAISSLSEKEIITLASIIEKEGNDKSSMKMISGILQNRLRINMPLQADATLGYILETSLTQLTKEDLKINSPYNTYTTIGLPPSPISNPGRMAIEAALFPTITDNFYYITGKDGKFYYAKTYKKHQQNIARYLR